MRGTSPRRLVLLVLAIALLVALLAISPITGAVSRRGAPRPTLPRGPVAASDVETTQKLSRGYYREGAGLLDDAEEDYLKALAATSPEVRAGAAEGLRRIRRAREVLGFAFPILTDASGASLRMRAPVTLVLVVLFLAWIVRVSLRRRGTRVMTFAVHGCADPGATAGFQDALLTYSNEIKRVYGSQYARRIGIQLFFDDFTGGPVANASVSERALAEARDVDTKAAVGFALRQAIQYLNDLPERPRFSVAGSVRLLPGAAMVVATVSDLSTGDKRYLEASVAEFADMPMRSFVESALLHSAPVLPFPWASTEAEDTRHVSKQLQALALILACKIRWRESEAITVTQRPGRWETVCLFAASARDLA